MLPSNWPETASCWLRTAKRPLIVTHRRPDGDALGALIGLDFAVQLLGGSPTTLLYEPPPPRYAFLKPASSWSIHSADGPDPWEKHDSLAIVDTCSRTQLEPIAPLLDAAPRTLVIDHHATVDRIAERPKDLRIIDPSAGAACLLLAEWFRTEGWRPDLDAAAALFTGITTDSGWFRFSNTDHRMLAAAAWLTECGANPNAVYAALFEQEAPARLRLIGRLLSNIEFLADGKLAVMRLRPADFTASGADRSMTEELVNEPMKIGRVIAALLFTEEPDVTRVNLRSKHSIDVAALAAEFNGGGHQRAAGARVSGDFEQAVQAVTRRAITLLSGAR